MGKPYVFNVGVPPEFQEQLLVVKESRIARPSTEKFFDNNNLFSGYSLLFFVSSRAFQKAMYCWCIHFSNGFDSSWKGLSIALTCLCGLMMLYIVLFSKQEFRGAGRDEESSPGEDEPEREGLYVTDLMERVIGSLPAISSILSFFAAAKEVR